MKYLEVIGNSLKQSESFRENATHQISRKQLIPTPHFEGIPSKQQTYSDSIGIKKKSLSRKVLVSLYCPWLAPTLPLLYS